MKRKVKSWADLKKIAEETTLGYLDCIGEPVVFAKGMKVYCGKEIQLSRGGRYGDWIFDEWMLEPIEQPTKSSTSAIFAELRKGQISLNGQYYYHSDVVYKAVELALEMGIKGMQSVKESMTNEVDSLRTS